MSEQSSEWEYARSDTSGLVVAGVLYTYGKSVWPAFVALRLVGDWPASVVSGSSNKASLLWL
ncbi:PA-phosphatase-like phosphoesterase [Anopheles sinensis]|uniref:PA-phosphatase-like phosphoesterase n=1 Tax=Anopheles sinensis TaxID=74873 RepID=A0A084VVI3_ANOSI|nr:PA-phosphatase-like phosphoesterase [Anopheles sinensis]